jgi:YD repeat-containing protein
MANAARARKLVRNSIHESCGCDVFAYGYHPADNHLVLSGGRGCHVNPYASVTVTFSEAIDAATVSGSTMEIRDSSNAMVSATVSYNAASFTATLYPAAPLAAGATYTVRIKGGGTDPRVKDLAGNALAADATWNFTTAQGGAIPLDGLASLAYNTASNWINAQGFEYDPAGNQTRAVINSSGAQQQYRYDEANRLRQVLNADGAVIAEYEYGASNERLVTNEGGVTTYYAWEGGRIIAEYQASGASSLIWKMSYVYLERRLLATEQAEGCTR